jgi:tRNA-binding protein
VTKTRLTEESTKETVKTIAQGKPDVPAHLWRLTRVLFILHARLWVSARHPAFPAPSILGQMIFHNSGAFASRECEGVRPSPVRDHRKSRAHNMPPLKAEITTDDFARLDIRIGKVVEIQPFPRARNPSYKVGVDVGANRIMWSSAQITNYDPAELVGSLVVCVCNFAPKNIAGFTSELLILGADNAEGKVIVLSPRSEVAEGEPVY